VKQKACFVFWNYVLGTIFFAIITNPNPIVPHRPQKNSDTFQSLFFAFLMIVADYNKF
jgi:hypothetical protein